MAKLFRKVYRILAALFRWRKTLKQNRKKKCIVLPDIMVHSHAAEYISLTDVMTQFVSCRGLLPFLLQIRLILVCLVIYNCFPFLLQHEAQLVDNGTTLSGFCKSSRYGSTDDDYANLDGTTPEH